MYNMLLSKKLGYIEKNIFDEQVYLNHDEQALKAYKSLFEEYYKFIDKVAKLLKCLNLQNSIEYSIVLKK